MSTQNLVSPLFHSLSTSNLADFQNTGGLRSSGHKDATEDHATIAKLNNQVGYPTCYQYHELTNLGRRRRCREVATEPSTQQHFRRTSSTLRPRRLPLCRFFHQAVQD